LQPTDECVEDNAETLNHTKSLLGVIARVMHGYKSSDAIGEDVAVLEAKGLVALREQGFSDAEVASMREVGREYNRYVKPHKKITTLSMLVH